jgi:hypothetical protein
MDPVQRTSQGGQADRVRTVRRAQAAEGTTPAEKTKGKGSAPKLDSKLLTDLGAGALEFLYPKVETGGKGTAVEATKGEKRAKTAVSVGGKLITGGIALSESGVGVAMIVAGVAIDTVAIAYGAKKGYGTSVAVDAAASCVPFIGGIIKKVVAAA